ncbi:MAG: CARDB domain-containing protein [Planctomycetota bacterium]|nr:CARDB domain-containing protein [Planctomycetota bacterium]
MHAPSDPGDELDIAPLGMALEPTTPVRGQPVLVRVGVENRGTQAATAFEVEWWASVSFQGPDKVWSVGGLAPGEKRHLAFTYAGYPGWYAELETRLILDPEGRLQGEDRANNAMSRTIAVARR